MFDKITTFIKDLYGHDIFIPLHEPRFIGNEREYLNDCIETTFVSSIGEYVNRFEQMICEFTGSPYAVAVTNGSAALHTALVLSGVETDDEVLTQALTFVATANSIMCCKAHPVFVDSATDNLGMCPEAIASFLKEHGEVKKNGYCYNKISGRRIKSCIPMHVFGHPVRIDEIVSICKEYNILVIEDAAESLGSYYKGQHCGTHADIGILSFNGNKIVTSGGGGMILLRDKKLAKKVRHLTTTAKVPHRWNFFHDMVGYNYRLPNINAALACAQIEQLPGAIKNKRETAKRYSDFFKSIDIDFIREPEDAVSNYWLNAIMLDDRAKRDQCLEYLNSNNIMARPVWVLMNKLPAFEHCQTTSLVNANMYEDRIVNIPSSVRL